MAARGIIVAIGALFLATNMPMQSTAQKAAEKSPEETRLIASLQGPQLFQAYCATCHGKDGRGNGPAASSLKAKPADLTRISERNGGKFPSAQVEKTISGDEAGTPAHGSHEMPIWGPIFGQIAWDMDLGKVRIHNLAKYIESLQRTSSQLPAR